MSLSGRGVALSVGASMLFALMPGYVTWLKPLGGMDVFAWRVLWSLPMVLLLVWFTGQGDKLRAALRRVRDEPLMRLAWPLAAALIGVQWWLFLWAPLAGHMLEVSMGYFLLPLAMVLAGRLVYGERLNRLQRLAVVCALAGVAHELWRTQAFSWLTLVTALGYPPYFILRRWMRLESLPGFTLELMLLAPVAAVLIWLYGDMTAFTVNASLWWLVPSMALLGTVAFVALMASSYLLPIGLFGILSYVEPVLLFVVALWVLGESFEASQWLTYAPIWAAVLLVAFDSARILHKQQRQARAGS